MGSKKKLYSWLAILGKHGTYLKPTCKKGISLPESPPRPQKIHLFYSFIKQIYILTQFTHSDACFAKL